MSAGRVLVGCWGWNYDHWRHGVFDLPRLPARDGLRVYAARFQTVEVNASFYRLPRRYSAERWLTPHPTSSCSASR